MERLKILIVDDEEDFVGTLAERLELRGFEVDAATSGSDALEHVGDESFSVLVLDVKMPGIDGLELMAQIKQSRPDLPVILLTGHGSADDVERGMKEGACEYLMKPVDIEELIERIKNCAGSKEGRGA